MKRMKGARILENKELVSEIYEMVLFSKEIAAIAKAGQFLNIYCNVPGRILPRPISISQIHREEGTVTIVYSVVGKGTKALSQMVMGEEIQVMGPLGNGFMIQEECAHPIIIGGGIGTPPLLELAKQLQGNVAVYLGFRRNPILVEAFEKIGAKVYVATEDGMDGVKGNVMDILREKNPKVDMVYSCGPKPMLRAIAQWAEEKGVKAQVSMEERMACGIGACVGCTCKTSTDKKQVMNKRVCKDGPVFWSNEVIWHD